MVSPLFNLIWRPVGDRYHAPLLFYSPFFALFFLCNLPASQRHVRTAGACLLAPLWLVWPLQFSLHPNPLQDDPTGNASHYGFLYFCLAFITLDRLVWTELESFQRVTNQVKDGKQVLEPVPKPFTWKRLKWTLSLIFSFRLSRIITPIQQANF